MSKTEEKSKKMKGEFPMGGLIDKNTHAIWKSMYEAVLWSLYSFNNLTAEKIMHITGYELQSIKDELRRQVKNTANSKYIIVSKTTVGENLFNVTEEFRMMPLKVIFEIAKVTFDFEKDFQKKNKKIEGISLVK